MTQMWHFIHSLISEHLLWAEHFVRHSDKMTVPVTSESSGMTGKVGNCNPL